MHFALKNLTKHLNLIKVFFLLPKTPVLQTLFNVYCFCKTVYFAYLRAKILCVKSKKQTLIALFLKKTNQILFYFALFFFKFVL